MMETGRASRGRLPPSRPGAGSTNGIHLLGRLRARLALLLAALFLAFYLVTSGLICSLTAQLTQDNVDAVLSDTTRPLAASVLGDLDRGVFPEQFVTLAKLSQAYPKVSAIVLRDAQGNVIASTAPLVTRTLPYKVEGSGQQVDTIRLSSGGW